MTRPILAALAALVCALALQPATAQQPAAAQQPVATQQAAAPQPAPAPQPAAAAPSTASGQANEAKDPRVALLKRLPAGSKLEDLRPSPIPGMYEFAQGADVSYLTTDGKYFIDGNVYDMDTRTNLTEAVRTHARVALIAAVPESQMVIFSPDKPRYTITVFTDVDCAYCRKLHSEMAELNKLGVRVRYVFFPRTGPDTESWPKAEAVWCAANRNEALTQAKAGARMDLTKTCGATPVAREYELGQSIGVRGTPAIVTEAGDLIEGYMPPQDLVKQLKTLQVAQR
jgi:thiol:disulfide interchange protein DsbC